MPGQDQQFLRLPVGVSRRCRGHASSRLFLTQPIPVHRQPLGAGRVRVEQLQLGQTHPVFLLALAHDGQDPPAEAAPVGIQSYPLDPVAQRSGLEWKFQVTSQGREDAPELLLVVVTINRSLSCSVTSAVASSSKSANLF